MTDFRYNVAVRAEDLEAADIIISMVDASWADVTITSLTPPDSSGYQSIYGVKDYEKVSVLHLGVGDTVYLNGTNNPGFTIKKIRDGMASGIGFRTTGGEYVKLPASMTVTRRVRA